LLHFNSKFQKFTKFLSSLYLIHYYFILFHFWLLNFFLTTH
jgi:hypothetical protein